MTAHGEFVAAHGKFVTIYRNFCDLCICDWSVGLVDYSRGICDCVTVHRDSDCSQRPEWSLRLPLYCSVLFLSFFKTFTVTYTGSERFLGADTTHNTVNHTAAAAVCRNLNATLPRAAPRQPITAVANALGRLAKLRNQHLHVWLDECASGHCIIWAIDKNNLQASHYKTYPMASTQHVLFVICEKGKLSSS